MFEECPPNSPYPTLHPAHVPIPPIAKHRPTTPASDHLQQAPATVLPGEERLVDLLAQRPRPRPRLPNSCGSQLGRCLLWGVQGSGERSTPFREEQWNVDAKADRRDCGRVGGSYWTGGFSVLLEDFMGLARCHAIHVTLRVIVRSERSDHCALPTQM